MACFCRVRVFTCCRLRHFVGVGDVMQAQMQMLRLIKLDSLSNDENTHKSVNLESNSLFLPRIPHALHFQLPKNLQTFGYARLTLL